MSRIKVLYICDVSIIGGSTLSLIDMIDSLREYVDPIVLVMKKGELYERLRLLDIECIVHPYYINTYGKNAIYRRPISYIKKLIEYTVFNKICIKKIANLLSKSGIQIIHSNSSAVTIGQPLANILGCKHVWHLREFLDEFPYCNILLGRNNLKKRFMLSDGIITITSPIARHWDIKEDNLHTSIWDAVCSKNDAILSNSKLKQFVVCSRYLSDFKGCDFAVEAFGKSKLYQNGYRLVFIGEYSESYKEKLNKIASAYHCNNHIDYLGFQKDVGKILANSTAYLMVTELEGMGRVSVEAMFKGCLVIGRNSGGTADFVKNEETGLLFKDVDECAEIMRKVAIKYPFKIAQNAQSFAVENFSKERYGEKILIYYKKLLGAN